jgi:hypothetical protein
LSLHEFRTGWFLREWQIGVLDQLQGHLWEPLAGGRVLHVAHRIFRPAGPTVALAVGLAGDLHPEVGIYQGLAGVGRCRVAQAAVGRVALVLAVTRGMAGRWDPAALAVAAGVEDESRQAGVAGIGHPGLTLDVVDIPLVGQAPSCQSNRRRQSNLLQGLVNEIASPAFRTSWSLGALTTGGRLAMTFV